MASVWWIAAEVLEMLGIEANAVPSDEAALERLNEHTADLLILEMVMDLGSTDWKPIGGCSPRFPIKSHHCQRVCRN
jgi:hypothetical protein